MIYILGPKDKKLDVPTINTTSSSNDFGKQLSPFFLGPCDLYNGFVSKNMENAWQFSKVYPQFVDIYKNPVELYWNWAKKGWNDIYAHRYPMGKNAIPLYSLWEGEKLNYIDARKKIYIPLYKKSVKETEAFERLKNLYKKEKTIALWDFDGYNHDVLNMSLEDVINNEKRKMGHAFVLKMLLEEEIA